jgi:hypothetical protein
MPSVDARVELAVRQGALVDALVAGAPVPPGFDERRVAIAAAALQDKRTREVAHAWPALAASLGSDFSARFGTYARLNAAPIEGGPWADGLAFVTNAVARRELEPAARAMRDRAVATHRIVRGRLVDRHRMHRMPGAIGRVLASFVPLRRS